RTLSGKVSPSSSSSSIENSTTVRLSAPRSWMSRLSGRISDTSLSECLAAKVQMTSWILSLVRVIIVFPQKSEGSLLWRHWHLPFVTQFLEVCIFWKAEGSFQEDLNRLL